MAQETFDYSAMLADARAKRAALDAFIASLEAGLAAGALGQPGSISGAAGAGATGLTGGPPFELPVGALMGKSVSNAIKLYLAACRKKQTTPQITAALKDGGVESTSKSFGVIVNNTLRILQKSGVVLKFKDGWALAELFPDSLRTRLAQQENGSNKKGNTKTKKRKSGRPPKTASAAPSAKQEPKIQEMPKVS